MQLQNDLHAGAPDASRSRMTSEQAPQSPSAQPSFGPVVPLARSQSSRVVWVEAPVTVTGLPLSEKRIASAMLNCRGDYSTAGAGRSASARGTAAAPPGSTKRASSERASASASSEGPEASRTG